MGGSKSTNIRTLTMIMPCGVDSNGTIFIQFHIDFSSIRPVETATVHTQGDADAALDFRSGTRSSLLFGFLVFRTDGIQNGRQGVYFRVLTSGRCGAFTVGVLVAELQRVHTDFFSEHVNEHFRSELGLGRTISTESGAPCVVGGDGAPHAANIGDIIPSTNELCTAQSQQIAELGVRPVINSPVCFHAEHFAVVVTSHANIHEERRTLASVLLLLLPGIVQENRLAGCKAGSTHQGLHGRGKLVAKGSASRVLNHDDVFGVHAEARGNHVEMQVQPNGFGMDAQFAFVVQIGKPYVRLNGHVRLATNIEIVFYDMGSAVENRTCFLAFGDALFKVDIGRTRMNLNGIISHGGRGAHVFGQPFHLDLDLGSRGLSILVGISTNNSNGIPVLEDLLVAQDGTIPTVTLVGGEGDQAGDTVFAFDVLVGNDLFNAGHFLGFGCIDGQNLGMRHFGLDKGQLQGSLRHLDAKISAVIQCAGHFGNTGGTRIVGAPDAAVFRDLEGEIINRFITTHDRCSVQHGVHQLFVPSTTAGVTIFLEPITDILSSRIRIGIYECLGRNNEARGTESALRAAVGDPRHLDGVQLIRCADTLGSGNHGSVCNATHLHGTGTDQLAIHNDRATAALAGAATHLDTGQPQVLTQDVGKGLV